MKNGRQEKMLELISQQDIETQEQLLRALAEHGYPVTQATISRDIKQLRLVKRAGPYGTLRYEKSEANAAPEFSSTIEKIFRQCVVQYSCAQNLVVIKTLPGLASAACSAIDQMGMPAVLGSIAGDDTAFIAMRDSASASAFCEEIHNHLQ